MSRSPLAYPLTRSIDGDAGGAADLQTDIMRFMAILALCLVAIFALVQSLPIEAQTPADPRATVQPQTPEPVSADLASAATVPQQELPAAVAPLARPDPAAASAGPESAVTLTRPQWVSTFQAQQRPAAEPPPNAPAPQDEQDGFTLRFESDIALTRLVAAGQVGFYAIESDRAQRMTVSESRISFWDASTPNSFHEMDAGTVPRSVIDALARTGARTGIVSWGVTLPGNLSSQLSTLTNAHKGGSLVIRADGNLIRETG